MTTLPPHDPAAQTFQTTADLDRVRVQGADARFGPVMLLLDHEDLEYMIIATATERFYDVHNSYHTLARQHLARGGQVLVCKMDQEQTQEDALLAVNDCARGRATPDECHMDVTAHLLHVTEWDDLEARTRAERGETETPAAFLNPSLN